MTTNMKVDQGAEILDTSVSTSSDSSHGTQENERSTNRLRLKRSIARSLEAEIREVTDASLGSWPAEIQGINRDADGLLVSIRLPFPIFTPSSGEGYWPPSRREQERRRKKYAEFLSSQRNEAKLASFFYQQLVNFMIEDRKFDRFGPDIIKHLKTIAQRELAGHPEEIIQPRTGRRIQREGKVVERTIESIRTFVKRLKVKDGRLQESTILRKLNRKFPRSRFVWIKHFYDLSAKLPRRRYWSSSPDESAASEKFFENGTRTPCTISEPNDWSIPDITAKVVQHWFRKETGKTFALAKIKTLVRKSSRPTATIAVK
jgi:hypothetical protein